MDMDMLDTPQKRVTVTGPGRVAMDNVSCIMVLYYG